MTTDHRQYFRVRIGIIVALVGMLSLYHIATIINTIWGSDQDQLAPLVITQIPLRLAIAASLLLVLFGVKHALLGMWLSIVALTITRCMLLWDAEPGVGAGFMEYLSYLRGFLAPAIITLLYPYRRDPAPIVSPDKTAS